MIFAEMAADSPKEFKNWLKNKLRELNTDESIFGEYILGILESDETLEEKTEALQGLLGELFDDNLNEIVASILDKWTEFSKIREEPAKKEPQIDVNEQLAKMLEAKMAATAPRERAVTEEERLIKQQILAQYSQTEISDDEADGNGGGGSGGGGTGGGGGGGNDDTQKQTGLARNTNVEDVKQLQKERREQARQDSAAKKLKDKEDRQKQKQEREEKKEKRKTVKGERRR